ncbi:hypothetical protein ACFS5M_13945 [Lacinutrix iliipiscaria]|uniref:Uncharacterized protein n=1 Tax=Lacinutrix iliipiscaria TaxID=1230532 RepID=A0ABW5WS26_9FLAO
MDISKKVLVLPNICGVEIDITGQATPSLGTSLQPFYNSYVQNSTTKQAYFTPSKVKLTETGKTTAAGILYTQKLEFKFPSNDPLRAMRIKDYCKVKYIYIKMSNGLVFFFGRNDIYQNSSPKISIVSTNKTTTITYTTHSIFTLGFTNGSFDFELSEEFPINFYNL